jgi:hypothetical protein
MSFVMAAAPYDGSAARDNGARRLTVSDDDACVRPCAPRPTEREAPWCERPSSPRRNARGIRAGVRRRVPVAPATVATPPSAARVGALRGSLASDVGTAASSTGRVGERIWRSAGSWRKPFPSSAPSASLPRAAPSRGRSRSPAWPSGRRASLPGCGASPRARTRPPASTAPCPRACPPWLSALSPFRAWWASFRAFTEQGRCQTAPAAGVGSSTAEIRYQPAARATARGRDPECPRAADWDSVRGRCRRSWISTTRPA